MTAIKDREPPCLCLEAGPEGRGQHLQRRGWSLVHHDPESLTSQVRIDNHNEEKKAQVTTEQSAALLRKNTYCLLGFIVQHSKHLYLQIYTYR